MFRVSASCPVAVLMGGGIHVVYRLLPGFVKMLDAFPAKPCPTGSASPMERIFSIIPNNYSPVATENDNGNELGV